MKVVFFGTPSFAVTILDFLYKKGAEIVAVVSRPDKPKGRSKEPQPTPVKTYALRHNLPLYQPQKVSEPSFYQFLQSLEADFFVVAAFAEILRENILHTPKFGCINVHASLLPKYRGAAPIQRALEAGEKETGVSIMKMVLEMDAGDVYQMVKIPIPETMNAGELTEILAEKGAEALWTVLETILSGKAQAVKQDAGAVTFAKKVKSEEGEIKWQGSAWDIHNKIRALTPNPGAWCWVEVKGEKKRLKILKALPQETALPPKTLLHVESRRLLVGCEEGALELLDIQLEGKNPLDVSTFLRGVKFSDLKF